jgi:hypothetical protein
MQYKLCTWEEKSNNSDHLDWFVAYYDSDDNKVKLASLGSTREIKTKNVLRKFETPNKDIVEKARVRFQYFLFDEFLREEENIVFSPAPHMISRGDRVSMLTSHRQQKQRISKTSCDTCKSTGNWVNPSNPKDIRECFVCCGTGYNVKAVTKIKNKHGKPVWERFSTNDGGEIIQIRKGISPTRNNTFVIFRTDNGKDVRCFLKKLRLAREPASNDELMMKAKNISFGYNFCVIFCKNKWAAQKNWAKNVTDRK